MVRLHLAVIAVLGLAAALGGGSIPASPRPPVAKKQPHTVEIHGDTLVDDYFWLRDKGTPEVESYLRAELAYSEAVMKPTQALQQKLYDEMLGAHPADRHQRARPRARLLLLLAHGGGQAVPDLRAPEGLASAPEEVILDVNALAEGKKFMSIGDMTVSPDGQLLAYTADETGFRQYTLRVKDLRTGQLRPDTAERVTSVEWTEDGKTLSLLGRAPADQAVLPGLPASPGRAPATTSCCEEKDERFSVGVWKSRDRKYLFVESGSLTATEIRYLPADTGLAEMKVIAERSPEHEYDVDHRDGTFWIRTNDKGRNFRLVTAAAATPPARTGRRSCPTATT